MDPIAQGAFARHRFARWCEARGTSTTEIARALGIDRRAVRDYAAGRFEPNLTTYVRITRRAGVALGEWIKIEGD